MKSLNNCEPLLNVITSITVVGKEISVQVNNAKVVNDVTLTEQKLLYKLFSTVKGV